MTQGINRLLFIQLSMTIFFSILAFFLSGKVASISAMLGGVLYVIPNACCARQLFKHQGARAAKKIVNGFYKGEALKIGLSIILFTLVFVFIKISPLVFFSVYVGMQAVVWFAPFILP